MRMVIWGFGSVCRPDCPASGLARTSSSAALQAASGDPRMTAMQRLRTCPLPLQMSASLCEAGAPDPCVRALCRAERLGIEPLGHRSAPRRCPIFCAFAARSAPACTIHLFAEELFTYRRAHSPEVPAGRPRFHMESIPPIESRESAVGCGIVPRWFQRKALMAPRGVPALSRSLFRTCPLLIRAGCQMCRQQQVLPSHLD